MNRGMHDNTDLINEFDFRVFRVFKFLKFASNLKRASIGFFLLCFSPMLALFRLKAASPRSGRLRRVQKVQMFRAPSARSESSESSDVQKVQSTTPNS